MFRMSHAVAFAALAAFGASTHAAIINGGFEQPNQGFHSVQPGQTYGNWTCAGPSDIEFVHAEPNASLPNLQFSAYEGEYWIDLCGVGLASAIYQDILSLNAGDVYNISFAQSGNVWGPNFNFVMNVLWNNAVVGTFSSVQGGNDGTQMNWQVRGVDVVAQSGTNRLTFQAVTAISARGPAIDDVSMTLVPAPSGFGLICAGAVLAGRRHRTQCWPAALAG
ncbi:MAG: hypothetical protein U0640_02985 [Phycisphaerales bacterium]